MFILLPYRSFVYVLCFPMLCFYGISVCAKMCLSASICVSYSFSLYLFILFVSSYSSLFVFILFYYHFSDTCLCSNERESKDVDLGGWGGEENLEEVRGGEAIIRIYYMEIY